MDTGNVYVHIMENSLAIKRNEVVTHVTTWANLEKKPLTRLHYYMSHCYEMSRIGKSMETE